MCGRSTSHTSAPRSDNTASAALNASSTSASTPSASAARGTPMRAPLTLPGNRSATDGAGSAAVVASRGSGPARTRSTAAASSTVRVTGPI